MKKLTTLLLVLFLTSFSFAQRLVFEIDTSEHQRESRVFFFGKSMVAQDDKGAFFWFYKSANKKHSQ